ncbi:MAG: CRISPR-associated helicase Cas3' [Firmicutes bacterium]|nr:CRISPR-associated helicase Cas3' [Bacillota bacterium]
MKPKEFYAHSLEGTSYQNWHLLEDHLRATANLARQFADEFGSGQWAYVAGLWHDLGKYSTAFQKKIRAATPGADAHNEARVHVDHSTAGALHAVNNYGKLGRILAYVIAGHHTGLPDWQADEIGPKALSQRLLNISLLDDAYEGGISSSILNCPIPEEKPKPGSDPAFWIRMLFSCLVDADYLDTEAFFEPEKADARGLYPPLVDLLPGFDEYMQRKSQEAPNTPVNRIRAKVLKRCIEIAEHPPGMYTLTVPTGGGKTLSSMAFALNHAVIHGKRRIIYVIPYTSIIEQTTDQFRQIFGDAVVEHHSNIDVANEATESTGLTKSRLACENWDAPIIVTTSVQFFESLFASRTSRCRKLHNIANSVVVFDEAQLLPPDFLMPTLHALKELTKFYGVTLLLCTATQPALVKREGFDGLENVEEIIDDPIVLHHSLKRVSIHVPRDLDNPISWDELAVELTKHESVLCIVNRRDDARELWTHMPEGTIHLSGLMCGEHRSKVIADIKANLVQGHPVRVISTQLVEAGVDIDFPIVYRALSGIDSIAQAAGRCNREGRRELGDVYVFVPQKASPPGLLRQTADIGRRLLAKFDDPIAPKRFEEFFKELYWLRGDRLDREGILQDLASNVELSFGFRTAAMKFQLIDEKSYLPVIVKYGDGSDLIDLLNRIGPERWLLRRLQRYIVNLPRYTHVKLLESGAIRELCPGIFVQEHPSLYNEKLGLCADKAIVYTADDLIV